MSCRFVKGNKSCSGLRKNLLKICNELGNVRRHYLPKAIGIDGIVTVDQAVSQGDDLGPRDFWMLVAQRLRNAARGLADYFQRTKESQVQHTVRIKVGSGASL